MNDVAASRAIAEWLQGRPANLPVIIVPVYEAYASLLECVDSLLKHTPPDVPIIIIDDASADQRIGAHITSLNQSKRLLYIRRKTNGGFVTTVNLGMTATTPHDVVLVNSDVIVPPLWLERLRDAAYHRSTIATATPLSNNGSLLSVPQRNEPAETLPPGLTLEAADARIRTASLRLRPIIPTAVGFCTYIRRQAIDLAGVFDTVFSPGYGEEVDFSQRTLRYGLQHVAADDVLVFHRGGRSFELLSAAWRKRLQEAHEEIIRERYPWFHPWVSQVKRETSSPLATAIGRARAALTDRTVAIDLRGITPTPSGTSVAAIEHVRALTAYAPGNVRVIAIVADHFNQERRRSIEQLVDRVITATEAQLAPSPWIDLIHRPYQLYTGEDLFFLRSVAHRSMFSQLDLIQYANPSYAATFEEWQELRRVTQLGFALMDGVAFNSTDVLQDAAHHGLWVPPERSIVLYAGFDQPIPDRAQRKPERIADPEKTPFLLMLGNDYRHKNRVYAIRAFHELVVQYNWPGNLVFAGPRIDKHASSQDDEERIKRQHPLLAGRILDLGVVSEAERRWLLAHASVVLYPSVQEGFGFIPFEAAALGTPALATRGSSLEEVLGDDVTFIDGFDPVAGAAIIWHLLTHPDQAQRQTSLLQQRARHWTWAGVAHRSWQFYGQIMNLPPRSVVEEASHATFAMRHHRGAQKEDLVSAWQRRIVTGTRVWREEGFNALRREIRRYLRWRFQR
ncbi:MAG: glycosyltransferase [Roseiflexaceae bacterium]|nr:glycosyltransferase [Roseiflexus sp.]MDW8234252.1 glycosyltransferase [Roseiflexaceae bacterium]